MGVVFLVMLNAFTCTGGLILLAEDLVRALPRGELDAVIAHELGHLRHRHIPILLITGIFPFFLLLWVLRQLPISLSAVQQYLIAIPMAFLVGGWSSQRLERAEAMGKEFGIPANRIVELLVSSEMNEESYRLPEEQQKSELAKYRQSGGAICPFIWRLSCCHRWRAHG
ncbi:MAG: hypothetical protein FJW20_10720 [Acidimicrobiia bacterium]|nr:hypothetical protein [Acidimicrobiia bacterium]